LSVSSHFPCPKVQGSGSSTHPQSSPAANRSGTKTCALCGERAILVEHHIRGRLVDGANQHWNTADICPNCHQAIHTEGRLVVEGWFMTTDGPKLLWHWKKDGPTNQRSVDGD
jgi:hypothetical protein